MAMIDNAKLLIGITGTTKDSLLALLQEQATQDFLDYTNTSSVPKGGESVILSMLVYKYNTLGAEGMNSQGYSSINETYINGYSDNIKSQLNHYRKVKLV